MHPVVAFRQLPRWRRILGARRIYRLYREWGNTPQEAWQLTWAAVFK